MKVCFYKHRLYAKNSANIRKDDGYDLFNKIRTKIILSDMRKEIGRCYLAGPQDVPRDFNNTVVINWGVSDNNVTLPRATLNYPVYVKNAVHKLTCLHILSNSDLNMPSYTVDKEVAYQDWFLKGKTVLARSIVSGSGGEGIEIINKKTHSEKYNSLETFPNVKLYSKYFQKTHEYRVHVFNGKVIHWQQKRKMSQEKLQEYGFVYNKMIRSYNNGWVFCTDNLDELISKNQIELNCINAVGNLGLDFGAVDVLVNKVRDIETSAICEINTAPGLEGTTLEVYAETFYKFLCTIVEKQSSLISSTEVV